MAAPKEAPTVVEVRQLGGRRRRGRFGPVLVGFEHGIVNPEAFRKFEPELEDDDDGGGDDDERKVVKLKLRAGRLSYSSCARSAKGSHRTNPYQKTFLAVRNKRSNQVRLVETTWVCVGAEVAEPPTSNSVLIGARLLRRDEGLEDAESKLLANKHVVGKFGQAKGKRVYEQADRMKIASEKLTDKLGRAAMGVSGEAIAMPSAISSSSATANLCPPSNRNAAHVREVYRIEDVLTSGELEELRQAVGELLEQYDAADKIADAVQVRKFTPMFGKMLERCLRTGEETRGHCAAAAAMYMDGIVHFLNMRPAAFAKGFGALPSFIPATVRQKIFREFTAGEHRTASPETNDRAACHAIVLALLLNEFSFQYSDFASSVRGLKADQVKKLIRVTGATLQTDALTRKKLVVLKLPLATFDAEGSFSRKGGGGRKP